MRSIVVVFALALAACAPFGVGTEPTPSEEDDVPKKKPATHAPADGPTADVDPIAGVDLSPFPGSQVFRPKIQTSPVPGVVVLHGEEGAMDAGYRAFAQQLAEQEGLVVLALCWFGCEGTPPSIANIDLERVTAAGEALSASPDTNGRVGLFGWNRGAEAALFLASRANTSPFEAVAVFALTDVVSSPPAWHFEGEAPGGNQPIEADRYRGPMLLAHGNGDHVWTPDRANAVHELRESKGGLHTETFSIDAGHRLDTPASAVALAARLSTFFVTHL